MVFVAIVDLAEFAADSPVFRFRSKRGKLLLEISKRIRWPVLKTLLVAHRSIIRGETLPGTRGAAVAAESRYLLRRIPSVILIAAPSGATSTSLAVKSVSTAEEEAKNSR